MKAPAAAADTAVEPFERLRSSPARSPKRSSRLRHAQAGASRFISHQAQMALLRANNARARIAGLQPLSSEEPVGLSILIPVYNEQLTIRSVLERVREIPFPARTEIIVVDDGSTDRTGLILRSLPAWLDIRVIVHGANQGKGAAVRTALRHARGRVVVIQDADEELDPGDLLPMYALVSSGAATVCYGSRFARCGGRIRWRPLYWANRLLNGACNLLNGLELTDMNTCYKMMRADVAGRLNLESRGFAMEPEITTKLARMGVDIQELPVSYRPRAAAEGKKIRALDFLRYLRAMVYFRFRKSRGFEAPTAGVEPGIRPTT